jgi:hypothetical protein
MAAKFGPCCLCGKDIEVRETDPCRVTVETSTGKWQVWVCHGACFRSRLVTPEGYPEDFFEPAHF